MDTALSEKQY